MNDAPTSEGNDQRLLDAAVAAWTPPVLAPGARAQVGDRLEAEARSRRRRRRVRRYLIGGLGAAAAAGVLLAAGVHWLRGTGTGDAPELVRTGPGQYRLLQLGDRAIAFVGENAEVEPRSGTTALFVRRGSVRLVVKSDRTRRFVVASPAADVAVLGTEFDVEVRDNVRDTTTEVRVVRGEVELSNPHGRRRVWPGEIARVRPGESPRHFERLKGIVVDLPPEIEAQPAPPPRMRKRHR